MKTVLDGESREYEMALVRNARTGALRVHIAGRGRLIELTLPLAREWSEALAALVAEAREATQ